MEKNITGFIPNTIYKDNFPMYKRFKFTTNKQKRETQSRLTAVGGAGWVVEGLNKKEECQGHRQQCGDCQRERGVVKGGRGCSGINGGERRLYLGW